MLTDLWYILPDWLFWRLVKWFRLEVGLAWIFADDWTPEDAGSTPA